MSILSLSGGWDCREGLGCARPGAAGWAYGQCKEASGIHEMETKLTTESETVRDVKENLPHIAADFDTEM